MIKAIDHCLWYAVYWAGDHFAPLMVGWAVGSVLAAFLAVALIRYGRGL